MPDDSCADILRFPGRPSRTDVIFVDDAKQPDNAMAFTLAAGALGYTVRHASSEREALELSRAFAPWVIVVDTAGTIRTRRLAEHVRSGSRSPPTPFDVRVMLWKYDLVLRHADQPLCAIELAGKLRQDARTSRIALLAAVSVGTDDENLMSQLRGAGYDRVYETTRHNCWISSALDYLRAHRPCRAAA